MILTPMMIFAQALGLLALAADLSRFQFKSQRRLFQLSIVTDAIWISHYAVLGAWPVVLAVSVSILRTGAGVFLWPDQRKLIALGAFLFISGCTIVFPPENPVGWLVLLTGAIYSATVVYQDSYGISRSLMFAGSVTWIVIGIGYGSIGETIASALNAGSILLAAWRHRQKGGEPQGSIPLSSTSAT